MSVCTFIASNCPLKEAAPVQDYPLEINLDNGQIYDGDADDNYFLLPLQMYGNIAIKRTVSIWNGTTTQRAEQNSSLSI